MAPRAPRSKAPLLRRLAPALRSGRRREEEAQLAREIQASLLPCEIPQLPGYTIDCAWQLSETVSGDYLDAFPLSSGEMAVCVADVSGRGLGAAQLAQQVRDAVRKLAPDASSPAEFCTRVNRSLCEATASGRYITMFYAVLHPSGRVRYENAGHCQPVLVRANGAVEFPASFSGVMGIFSHWLYQNQEVQLDSGDCLLVLTDGILEAENRRREAFGYRRLIAEAEALRTREAGFLARKILGAVSRFCEGRFDDDASIIAVIKV